MAEVESELKDSTLSSPVTQKEAGRAGPCTAYSVFPDSLHGCLSTPLRLQVTGLNCTGAHCFLFSFLITMAAEEEVLVFSIFEVSLLFCLFILGSSVLR